MSDLNEMNDAQLEEYRVKVSKFVGLDPEQNLLKFFWMDNGSGMRNRVLYAPRGATEILRANNGISITRLLQTQIDENCVTFIAEGTNKDGRVEIAAGAASTKGLTGERLSSAVMTSSTRAIRRMTLQFAGYGILDESEVLAVGLVTSYEPMSLAPIAPVPPAVPFNESAGKEVKKETLDTPPPFEPRPLPAQAPVQAPVPTAAPTPEPEQTVLTEEVKTPKIRKKRGPNKSKAVDLESIPESSMSPVIATIKKPDIQPDIKPVEAAPVPPVATVPAAVIPVMETKEPDIKPDVQPVPTIPGKTPPTTVQNNAFRKELQRYADDVLPNAGMVGSEGIGGCGLKLKAFGKSVFSGLDLGSLSVEEQAYFLETLEKTIKTFGPAGLVMQINERIGAR